MITEIFNNLSSWTEFKSRLSGKNTKVKGDAFELLIKYYLQIEPTYKTKLKSVWLLTETPFNLQEKLNLPALDKGIDIIVETFTNEYWAIQCKYKEDEDSSVTWDELSTFTGLSFGICKNISFGLICTSTNRVTDILSTQDNIGFCTGEIWRNLDYEFFNQLNHLLEQKPFSLKPLSPKPHQISAITHAKRHYIDEDNTRGKMIMPCGTGKSMAAYWIAVELNAKSLIVAVPSLALIRQMLKAWLREAVANGRNINWICVASDETVGKIDRDDIAIIKQDLGIPTYTNSDKISDWLMAETNSIKIVFTTYQSGKTIAAASRKADFIFDFGVMDEAHKTVGSNRKLFSHLLFDENISIKKRLFMTATERRYAGLSDEILSMENEEIYGDTFELLSFKEAIEYQPPILSDYKIITITVDKEEIKELIQKNAYIIPDKGKWDEEVEAGMLASIIALQKAFIKFPIKHAVSFHSTISKAKAYKQTQSIFSEVFPEFKKISSYHVSGRLATSVRDKIIREFAVSPISLITNARCLNEGVDIPNIDCILFADPKKSTIDIVQAVGRALRIAEGKEFGYIIIPILTDSNKNFDDLIDDNSFKDIIITLRALAANDERIIDYFRNVTQGQRKSELFVLETDEKFAEVIDTREFNESIYLRVWDRLGKLSWRPYEEAKNFANRFGFTSSMQWMKYCRGEYKHLSIKPPDIPSSPNQVYKGSGWISWGEWLRTKRIALSLKKFREFKEAKIFVRSLKLNNSLEWYKYINGNLPNKPPKPIDIPSNPSQTYKNNGWKGMSDWLGTSTLKKNKSIPFDEVKISASALLSKNISKISSISANNSSWCSYEKAKKYINSYSFTNIKQWKEYCKGYYKHIPPKPPDIPSNPDFVYFGAGWISWGEWFRPEQIVESSKQFLNFEDARQFARKLTLKNSVEWELYINGMYKEKTALPLNIPTNPQFIYRNKGWRGWTDFLETPAISPYISGASTGILSTTIKKKDYCSYEVSREFARKLNLKNYPNWLKYVWGGYKDKVLLPLDIPSDPQIQYKGKGWINWNDFLGTSSERKNIKIYGNRSKNLLQKNGYRNFAQARDFIRQLDLRDYSEWLKYIWGEYPDKIRLPNDIPINPNQVYKNKGWKGYEDWLGVNK